MELTIPSLTIWQLRTSYLSNIKDGIGDRLINVNNSLLNIPGFRAAGWSPALLQGSGHEGGGSQIKRTYSPPIPTTATVASEYYRFARHAARGEGDNEGLGAGEDGEEDEGGMVTGGGGGTYAFGIRKRGAKKNRRRGRQQNDPERREAEDDDSSDLSDESEEEEDIRRSVWTASSTEACVLSILTESQRGAKYQVHQGAGANPGRIVTHPKLSRPRWAGSDGDDAISGSAIQKKLGRSSGEY